MADQEIEPVKKKGGNKMVIIIISVAMLFTGGFFGLKFRNAQSKPAEIKLGEIETIKEFLVNLNDGKTYLRTEIALHFVEGFKKDKFEKFMPAMQDAISGVLAGRSVKEISSIKGKGGKVELKRDIGGLEEMVRVTKDGLEWLTKRPTELGVVS